MPVGSPPPPSGRSHAERLTATGEAARAADSRGDVPAANEAWRRYRLIEDAMRDPNELLAEGMALSRVAQRLAAGDE